MPSWGPWIKGWILSMLDGKPIPPINPALLNVNLNQEVECPLLTGGAKKLVVCTSSSHVLGRMEVTDGDVFISVYLTPDAQHNVEVEDDYDLATLSGTLIHLDKWVFSSVVMAASMSQRKDQTTPLCIQAHAISFIGRDDTDFMMHGRRIVDINEDKMVKERLDVMTHGMLVSRMETSQNLQTGLPNCEGRGVFCAAPYEPLNIGETNRQRLRQSCPPPRRNELKDLRERGTCEDEYNTQEPYDHEDLGTGGSQPETQLNTSPLTQTKGLVGSDQEHTSQFYTRTQQPYGSSDEYLVAQYLAQSILTPSKRDSAERASLGAQNEGMLSIQQPPFEDSQVMLQNSGNQEKNNIEGNSPGRFSLSSLESVPSPTPTDSRHHEPNRIYSSFKCKMPLSGTDTISSIPQTNISALTPVPEEGCSLTLEMAASEEQQQDDGTTSQDQMTINVPDAGRGGTKRRENDDERPIWCDSRRQFERRAINNKKDYSSSSMNFLISAFLAGPEAALRPERKNHDKEEVVQSTSSLSMSGNGENPLTNNSAIAYFMNPKLWRTVDNIGDRGMVIEERGRNLSLTPPMNKQLQKKFLLRYKDIPDPISELPSEDGSKFDLYQSCFDCHSATNNAIHNSIYRLGLGRTS